VIIIVLLGTIHLVRANLRAQRAADAAEHAQRAQVERDKQAKEQAALADPNVPDSVKAKLKADHDALEEQRIKWQLEAVERAK
jgi:hypothetical protein